MTKSLLASFSSAYHSIMNTSFYHRAFARAWKIAEVTPVHKSGDWENPSNNHPFSLYCQRFMSVSCMDSLLIIQLKVRSWLPLQEVIIPETHKGLFNPFEFLIIPIRPFSTSRMICCKALDMSKAQRPLQV